MIEKQELEDDPLVGFKRLKCQIRSLQDAISDLDTLPNRECNIESLKALSNFLLRILNGTGWTLTASVCNRIYLAGRKNMQEEIAKSLDSYEMPKAVQIAYSVPVDVLDAQTPNT